MARSCKWPVGAAQVGGAAQRDGQRRALLGVVLRVGGKERGKEKGRREKKKREKGKREKEKWRERELSAGFAAAVGHARAAAFGWSATSTWNEKTGKGIGRRLVLMLGRRIAGKGFEEIRSSEGKGFGRI